MFFKVRNLRVAEVEAIEKPWEWDTSGVDFDVPKEVYRSTRYYDATAEHCLVSLVEGLTPTLRVSSKRSDTQNPAYRVHGIFADFDGVFDAQSTIETLRRDPPSPYQPTWYVVTQSKKLRLVWLFETPVRVTGSDHANRLLADIALRISSYKWGSDYDKKASESCTTYFDIGREWHRFSESVIPTSVLHLWDYEVFSKIRESYSSVTTFVPLDVVQQEIRERWPGRFTGTVKEGEHCCRFWDPDSDNDRGCIFVKDGVRVFVPHDKPFMSWRDIFGAAFVDKFVSSKVSPVVQQMWYNSCKGQFWRWSESSCSYVPRNETTIRRDLVIEAGLRSEKRKGEGFSEVDQALHDITTRREVAWVAPVLFHPHGPMRLTNSERTLVLNTSLVRVTSPCEESWTDDWRWSNPAVRDKMPFIHGLISTLFEPVHQKAVARIQRGFPADDLPDEESIMQLKMFLSWLSYFYRTSAVLKPAQGQCLVLAGPSGVGKSFLMKNVIGPLMGGYSDADDYFVNAVKYTGDIVRYPVLGIDDKTRDLEKGDRAGFTTRLKSVVATGTLRYEEKFQNAVETLPWLGRVIITCNMDSRSLSVLPDLEQSNADKIMMLRLGGTHYCFNASRDANNAAVMRELPYFARFLLNHPVDERIADVRMGVKAYQHPDMVQAASENGYTQVIIDALNAVVDATTAADIAAGELRQGQDPDEECPAIRGNARVIFDLIRSVSESAAREIRGARNLALGLETLLRGGYRITRRRVRATTEWIIPYDFGGRPAESRYAIDDGEEASYGTVQQL